MIVFYEDLPCVGKSYAPVTKDILDALKIDWHAVTNVAGLNFEIAAELLEKAVSVTRKSVRALTDEGVMRIHEHVIKDAFYVLSKGRDYWPSSFKSLDKATTKFVTKHGRDDINIILIGQNPNDLHSIWKRRVDRKCASRKKDAIGKPNEFKWAVYKEVKGQKGDRFERIPGGSRRYGEEYFGLHRSHTDDTTNTDMLEDSNANVLKTKVFRVWILLLVLVAFGAAGFLVYLFRGGGLMESKPEDKYVVTKTVAISSMPPVLPAEKAAAAAPAKASDVVAKLVSEDDDSIAGLVKKYRPRLEGWARVHGQADVIVAWYDDSTRVRERLLAATVEDPGWEAQELQYGQYVILAKGERRIIATMQPIDTYGKVPGEQADGVRAMSGTDSRAARDERIQNFDPQGWRTSDGQVTGRGVVDLPPSIVNVPDDTMLPRCIQYSSAFDGTQH